MRGTVTAEQVELDDSLDRRFKPGVYLETQAFLQKNGKGLLPLAEHNRHCRFYRKIEGLQ